MIWLVDNIGTIAAAVILLAAIGLSLFLTVRNKKKGKSPCGCGCSGCAMNGACQKGK